MHIKRRMVVVACRRAIRNLERPTRIDMELAQWAIRIMDQASIEDVRLIAGWRILNLLPGNSTGAVLLPDLCKRRHGWILCPKSPCPSVRNDDRVGIDSGGFPPKGLT